jgi:DNA end-binding protein Ku
MMLWPPTIEAPEEKEDRANVVDLMEALRQSVKGKRAAALRSGGDSKKRSKPRAQRRQRKRKAA